MSQQVMSQTHPIIGTVFSPDTSHLTVFPLLTLMDR